MWKRLACLLTLVCMIGCRPGRVALRTDPLIREGTKPADLVVLDARVFTSDEKRPWAQAVAVKDGRFVYVGDDAGVHDHIGPNTRVIDARQHMLTPGFVDNHCHFLWIGALKAVMVSLYEAEDFESMRKRVLEFAATNRDYPLVLGVGWRYAFIPGGLPDAKQLDALVPDRPAFFWSLDGQVGWVNTPGLARLRERSPEMLKRLGPVVGANGEPTGLFHEFHAFTPLELFTREELGKTMEERMFGGMESILDSAVSLGTTSFNDAQIHEGFLPWILEFKEKGGLRRIRARLSLYVGHHVLEDENRFRETLGRWQEFGRRYSDARFWAGDSVKLYIDGVFGAHTASMLEPYANKPESLGRPCWTPEAFTRVIEIVDEAGIQACTHSIGDAGIRTVIDAYESAIRKGGPGRVRHRIEHCELPTAADRKRMADLGIIAAMHPTHSWGDLDMENALGRARLDRLMPWRGLEEAGVEVSFGSDWCAGPENPVYGLFLAATRMNYHEETDWGPSEAISLESAIRHWTIGSARALLREAEIGSIEVGKRADMVLFQEDLTELLTLGFLLSHEIELGKLDDFVLLTFVDGEIVYKKPGFRF